MAKRLSLEIINEIKKIAPSIQVRWPALAAIVETESAGRTGSMIRGHFEPIIRFEGHYFHRLLKHNPAKLKLAVKEGLAHPKAGRVKNPRSQVNRWEMLRRAIRIDRDAALASVSWGLGQVMGDNWLSLGYNSVQALVNEARSGVGGQIRVMVAFIKVNKLVNKLRALDWAGFANRYNGSGYKKNKYDTKMANAYTYYNNIDKWHKRIQVSGLSNISIQKALNDHGYKLIEDGIHGTKTILAIEDFQRRNALMVDGIVGEKTKELLFNSLQIIEPPKSTFPPLPQIEKEGLTAIHTKLKKDKIKTNSWVALTSFFMSLFKKRK